MPIPKDIQKYLASYPWRTQVPEYNTWKHMLSRCNNPNHHAYKSYGGRGIKVCKRWHKFENFVADMGIKPDGHTLDRINVNGNYEPRNCRWATKAIQANNTRKRPLGSLNIDFRHIEEYKVWIGILSRCYNRNDTYYAMYGGRGVRLSHRWTKSFANFLEDMGRRPSRQHWLAMKDSTRNYTKSNCYWALQGDVNRRRARLANRANQRAAEAANRPVWEQNR